MGPGNPQYDREPLATIIDVKWKNLCKPDCHNQLQPLVVNSTRTSYVQGDTLAFSLEEYSFYGLHI